MPSRIAGILGLIAFAYCLVTGLLEAGNTFSTIVWRAVLALVGTVVLGHLIGWVAQAMLNDHLAPMERAARDAATSATGAAATPGGVVTKSEDLSKGQATDGR